MTRARHTIWLKHPEPRGSTVRSQIDGLTWTAIGFLALVGVLTFMHHDYSSASTAVLLAFVLVLIALRHGEDEPGFERRCGPT